MTTRFDKQAQSNMNNLFYTQQQLKVFAEDLYEAFARHGYEVVEEPYIDYALCGFRAVYIRRYLLQKPTQLYDGILTTLIHVVGLPFGSHGQKMVILSAPRNIENEQIAETLKLRIHFDEYGLSHVINSDQQQSPNSKNVFNATIGKLSQASAHPSDDESNSNSSNQFAKDLASYVTHITEAISPGLIELPTEMKLEILKKLSIDSIMRMSQVNNEFRVLIFQHGESLWRHLCMRDFDIKFINRGVHRSWMELYRDTYIIHQDEICRKERALPGLPIRPALPPVPYRLQIEWFAPRVLELPFYPLPEAGNERMHIALEWLPLRRADSLDSIP